MKRYIAVSESKHTLGPWTFKPTTLEISHLIVSIAVNTFRVEGPKEEVIAYLPSDYKPRTAVANVRLIAAAPDLLAILERIKTQLDCPSRNTTVSSYRRDGLVIISSDLRLEVAAAIAKARGL